MKLIIITEDHYIVVDETIQPVDGWYYDTFIKKIRNTNNAEYGKAKHCLQITYSTDIGWNEVYYVKLSDVKELIGEVDVPIEKTEWTVTFNEQGNLELV